MGFGALFRSSFSMLQHQSMRRISRQLILEMTGVAAFCVLSSTPLAAANVDWVGTTNDWFTASNWGAGALPTDSDTVTIDGSVVATITHSGAAADGICIGALTDGALSISNAGTLSIASGITAGSNVGVTGTLNITGATTNLSTDTLLLGDDGIGIATIAGGATATISGVILGTGATGSGTLTIEGEGTTVTTPSGFLLGAAGVGHVSVLDGASVDAGIGFTLTGADGVTDTLTASGAGTNVASTGNFFIDENVNAQVLVSGGATLTSGTIALHYSSGTGVIQTVVTGEGTTWTSTGALAIGSNATLEILDGAVVHAGSLSSYTGANALVIDGAGSQLDLGSGSVQTLGSLDSITISNGGVLTDDAALLMGYGAGTQITVTGTGSAWNNTGGFTLGRVYTVAMTATFSNGASLTSSSGQVGYNGGIGSLSMDGQGTSWINTGSLYIGYADGVGTLSVTNGATVTNTDAVVGHGNGVGSVILSGDNARWTIDGDLVLGRNGGTSSFSLTDASVSMGNATTGFAQGNAIIAMNHASWLGSGTLILGMNGINQTSGTNLTAVNGSTITSAGTTMGTGGAYGHVLLSGAGTVWTNNGTLTMGFQGGDASLTVLDGAVMTTGDTTMATSGATANLIVSGAGSTFTDTGFLYMGDYGSTATLTLAHGGVANIAGGLTLGADFGTGVLIIGAASGQAAVAPGTLLTSTVTFGAGTGSIIFNHTSTNYVFAADLVGAGTLSFLSGKTILTGDSSLFTGTTIISGGTVAVNGAISGSMDVQNGGRLQGNGTVSSVTVDSGATIAPGNSIGTLHVVGDISFASGSLYEVEIDPSGAGDSIIATGSATLAGTLRVLAAQGIYRAGTRFPLLTAAGGITGQFDTIETSLGSLFLAPFIDYGATETALTMTRNARSFASVAATPNQVAAAEGVESMGRGNLYDVISSQSSEDEARRAFQQIAGEVHADVKGSLQEYGAGLADALLGRMAESADSLAGDEALRQRQIRPRGQKQPSLAPVAWAQAMGQWGARESDGNARRASYAGQGLLLGMDGALRGGWRSGLAFGAARHRDYVDDGTNARGTTQSYSLSFYGMKKLGAGAVARLGGAYGFHDIETKRHLDFTYEDSTLTARHSAHTVTGFGELAYGFVPRPGARLEPFANMSVSYLALPSFTEEGGDGALVVHDGSAVYSVATMGLRGRQSVLFLSPAGGHATIEGMLAWRRAIGDTGPDGKYQLSGGAPFTVTGAPLARDAAQIEAGYNVDLSPQATVGLFYSGLFANKTNTQAVNGKVRVAF